MRLFPALVLLLLACSPPGRPPGEPAAATTLSSTRGAGGAHEIRLDGVPIGQLRRDGSRWTLRGDSTRASLERFDTPLAAGRAYPRRIALEGRLGAAGTTIRQEFTLLAPPAALSVEGLGLEVSTDEPGTNHEEHRELRGWLEGQGLPPQTEAFEALHQADSGRELRVWYEISGRRIDGRLTRSGSAQPLARFDSLFRTEEGQLKIHHKRPGENGRFRYHRQSLELVDTITPATGGLPELRAHQCGCYGYAIAADFVTLGPSLYHVEADWQDDRVAADFFLGLERRDGFPWLGLGNRRRMRDLARRVKAYRLKDAGGRLFAEVSLDLPADPASPGLGAVTYHVDRWGSDGERAPLARIDHTPEEVVVHLFGSSASPHDWEASLEQLDVLFAAMPTQVMRGDGVRDSHLGDVERLVDWVRLIRQPSESRLADVVSDIDALTAVRKVQGLLEPEAERFLAEADALPPAPRRFSSSSGS